MKLKAVVILLSLLFAVCCSKNRAVEESAEAVALDQATEVVAKLKESIETDYTLTPAVYGGVPVVSIMLEDGDADYMPTVESILKAVGSVEGPLRLVVQRPMETSEAEKASGVKDAMFIVARFDAKTGERIP